MPSTSVQIHSSAASSAAARMEAEKSEPPRPSVVGRPSAVAPLKAGDHRQHALAQQRQQPRPRLLARGLHQRRGVAENRVGDHHVPGVHGRGGGACGLQALGHQQRGKALAGGHGLIHRARRPLVEHGHAVDDALEFADQLVDLGLHGRPGAPAGSSSRQASSWRRAQDAPGWPPCPRGRRLRRGAWCPAAGR